jgi:PPOX class F420-dependent enzyme/OxyR family protein
MSSFTPGEIGYLRSQPLTRLATQQANGTLQANPVAFRYDAETDRVVIGGFRMASTQKFRNVAANGCVALVVDADSRNRRPATTATSDERAEAAMIPVRQGSGSVGRREAAGGQPLLDQPYAGAGDLGEHEGDQAQPTAAVPPPLEQ